MTTGKATSILVPVAGPMSLGASCSNLKRLAQRRELEFMSIQLSSIGINSNLLRYAKRDSFIRCRKETPEVFVFSLKGPSYATNRRALAAAADSIARFFNSGVLELRDKLGPLLWQFAPTKKYDP
jgi:uncharacterized protein YecE (DUF72 family)